MESKRISVIIPALNEQATIKACLESAQSLNPLEIIVVDGGSTDRTREIAQYGGAIVTKSSKGRGMQMNKGASLAKGEILLFLHADTVIANEVSSFCHPELDSGSKEMLESETMNLIRGKIHHDITKSDKHIGGFFRLKFDDNSVSTRLVELFANVRARVFSLPYGDQAIFIKRDVFEKIGGFREYPFLEDIDLVMRSRKLGKLKYIPYSVIASSRRIKKGFPFSPIIVSLRNVVIAFLFMLGVRPSKLIKLYA